MAGNDKPALIKANMPATEKNSSSKLKFGFPSKMSVIGINKLPRITAAAQLTTVIYVGILYEFKANDLQSIKCTVFHRWHG